MAGTDHSAPPPPSLEDPTAPAVILVAPQLGQNIGAAARAMLNCGLTDLRLVRPRDGWPNPKARVLAAGAEAVLDRARVYATTAEATTDLTRIFATTARQRDLAKPVLTPEAAAGEIRELAAAHGRRCGLLFGPERTGLDTDEVAAADAILYIPLNPAYASLNLGQAVLLAAYAWWMSGNAVPPRRLRDRGDPPARRDAVTALLGHLGQELAAADFWKSETKRPAMWRTLQTFLLRGAPTEAEVGLLHGVITALSGRRLDGRRRGAPRPKGPTGIGKELDPSSRPRARARKKEPRP